MKNILLTLSLALLANQFNSANCTEAKPTEDQNVQMIYAVEHGKSEDVAKLLKAGVSANLQEKNGGHTLLQMAVTQREMEAPVHAAEIVKMLLEADANPNLTSNAGNTPLIYVVKYANRLGKENVLTIIEMLLSKKADLDITNKKGETVMSFVDKTSEMADQIKKLLENNKK